MSQVRIGDVLCVKVLYAAANIDACCLDEVVAHLCAPQREGDREWWFGISELGPNSGIFFSQSGMALLPVWDAVGGYQLPCHSRPAEANNEVTILARYNLVKVVSLREGQGTGNGW